MNVVQASSGWAFAPPDKEDDEAVGLTKFLEQEYITPQQVDTLASTVAQVIGFVRRGGRTEQQQRTHEKKQEELRQGRPEETAGDDRGRLGDDAASEQQLVTKMASRILGENALVEEEVVAEGTSTMFKLVSFVGEEILWPAASFLLETAVGGLLRFVAFSMRSVLMWGVEILYGMIIEPIVVGTAALIAANPLTAAIIVGAAVVGGAGYMIWDTFFSEEGKAKRQAESASLPTGAVQPSIGAEETAGEGAAGVATPEMRRRARGAYETMTPEEQQALKAKEGVPYTPARGAPKQEPAEAALPLTGGEEDIKKMIIRHEGYKTRPYRDSLGLWTVGVGHLIGDGRTLPESWNREFSKEEVMGLFEKDYASHRAGATKVPNFDKLNSSGQGALIDLTFNMGITWFKKWPAFVAAMQKLDIRAAADSLMNSKWYTQVGNRAKEIINLLLGGLSKGAAPATAALEETKAVPATPAPTPPSPGVPTSGAPADKGAPLGTAGKFNVAAAVAYLRGHKESKSTGACARYVRLAIQAGGINVASTNAAKDYGGPLSRAGFQPVSGGSQAGDVAVIQPVSGHPFGHMCMWDGQQWISDFAQRDMYPGQAYRDVRPPFQIYRHPACYGLDKLPPGATSTVGAEEAPIVKGTKGGPTGPSNANAQPTSAALPKTSSSPVSAPKPSAAPTSTAHPSSAEAVGPTGAKPQGEKEYRKDKKGRIMPVT